MTQKEFLNYEQALALKELGFDEECLWFTGKEILAPLYQQAFRWFRENHSLIGEIFSQLRPSNKFMYGFKIGGSDIIFDGFKTYEEAEDACINKLIEIVKNKQ
jgi:hypothetical protein